MDNVRRLDFCRTMIVLDVTKTFDTSQRIMWNKIAIFIPKCQKHVYSVHWFFLAFSIFLLVWKKILKGGQICELRNQKNETEPLVLCWFSSSLFSMTLLPNFNFPVSNVLQVFYIVDGSLKMS